jgi:menaquinol-cytochrome c reductase iron-sulfur subunit
MNRRKLLERAVQAVALGIGGVLAVPAALNILSPVRDRRRGEHWQPIGPLEQFPVGAVTKALVPTGEKSRSLAAKGVFVWRLSDDELVVYSRNCTDLSCPITWDEGSGWFYCPCHGGMFTREGDPVAGPPSRPLYRYMWRIVRDGDGRAVVQIDLNSLPPIA